MTISEEAVTDVIGSVAIAAFSYYPEIHVDAESYDLMATAASCLDPLRADLPADTHAALVEMIARAIIDPTKHREPALDTLMELVPES